MAKILLQTTIAFAEDDWNVSRFSLLREALEADGHEVVARNEEMDANRNDHLIMRLPDLDFDQLWLMAVDTGDGLTQAESDAIIEFRKRGGGVLTARDHQDLGLCLCHLGSLGQFNHFHTYNLEPGRTENDDQDNPNISYPNYHSGANGNYQKILAVAPVHPILRSAKAEGGTIEYFPAHPHEGAVGVSEGTAFARVVATGTSTVSGRKFNLAVAVEGEPFDGGVLGRAVAISTFHHLADLNWDTDRGAPSFVTDKPGYEIKRDPARLEIFKDYVRNIARWLGVRPAS
ncbi:MAG TPA: hypothetical protein VGX91_15120 [Candidatus Cybelea sp.]|jgi:hypothetical protein|nr:hypothetical protein [Candidatus Cybelea sp.]